MDSIKKENKIETEEAFQAALKQEGMTLEDLRKQIERNMLASRVQQVEVQGKIAVSEDEVKAYYESAKDSFTTQPQLTLREILVNVPGSDKGINVAADDQARMKAEDMKKRADGGELFAKLAADYSDSPSKANGGLIGPINRSELSPELLKEITPLKVGQTTRVLRTTRGYQIIKLESRSETVVPQLEAVRNQVADRVFREKGRPELAKYLQKLRDQAIIEWKNDDLKKAYDVFLANPDAPSAPPARSN